MVDRQFLLAVLVIVFTGCSDESNKITDKSTPVKTVKKTGKTTPALDHPDFEIVGAAKLKQITNSIDMKLVLIPAGEFMMGNSKNAETVTTAFKKYGLKPEYFKDEYPQHKVKISKPFYIGTHEVTVGQFRKFAADSDFETDAETDTSNRKGGWGWNEDKKIIEGGIKKYTWANPGFHQTIDHPVVNVSWNDAIAFCKWLSAKEGKTYRLPTEAQWEYACRAGTTTHFYSGDNPKGLSSVANIGDASLKKKTTVTRFTGDPPVKRKTSIAKFTASWNDHFPFTASIGLLQPNNYGLHDMHGNVWELCADWYANDYYGKSPVDDPAGPAVGTTPKSKPDDGKTPKSKTPKSDPKPGRVLRGGSWLINLSHARSANRYSVEPKHRSILNGFRVVRTP